MTRRPSRYHAAQARRARQQRESDNATRVVTQLATAGVLLAFGVVVVFTLQGPGGFAGLRPFMQPWLGPFTMLDVIGVATVALIGVVMWRRLRR